MNRRKEIKVGVRPVRDAAREFIAVCEAIDKGERPALIERIDFEDIMTFARILTPRRLELLRVLHASGKMTVCVPWETVTLSAQLGAKPVRHAA